jgi:hypothetical protein
MLIIDKLYHGEIQMKTIMFLIIAWEVAQLALLVG